MEENFGMEWNGRFLVWNGKGMEKIASMEYGKIVFHSIPYHALIITINVTTFNCLVNITAEQLGPKYYSKFFDDHDSIKS